MKLRISIIQNFYFWQKVNDQVVEKLKYNSYLKDAFGLLLELLSDPSIVVKPSQDLVPLVDVQEAEVIFLNLKTKAKFKFNYINIRFCIFVWFSLQFWKVVFFLLQFKKSSRNFEENQKVFLDLENPKDLSRSRKTKKSF